MQKYMLCALLVCVISGSSVFAQTVMVGGNEMFPSKNIVENAVKSAEHTTLVAAVKAGGLVETLMTPGPFTVFAPVNAAFSALPAGTVESLLKPENKSKLVAVLTYHVVAGKYDFAALEREIQSCSNGIATLKTVQGETLTIKKNGDTNLMVVDAKGNAANITITNVNQSNGVIHVIDKVLLP